MHRTGHEEVRNGRPWLWTALAGVVVTGAVIWVMRPEPVACRSEPDTTTVVTLPAPTTSTVTPQQLPTTAQPVVEHREARFYAFTPGVACSLPDLPLDGYYIGVPTEEYDGSAACGTYVDIDGPLGSVRAMVVDRCPGCGPGQYDLSRAAFEEVAHLSEGVVPIRIAKVRDPNPAPELFYRVQPGSSPDWLGVLFSGNGNPLRQISLRPEAGGEWIPLRRGYDNYWSVSGAGPGPFTALVTDIYGHEVLVGGLTLNGGDVRFTGIRLYPVPESAPPEPAPTTPPVLVVTTVIPGARHCDS
ncbi:expansin EXLX1 family cellulose-binding protein [Nocardia sp. IFM 10818]